MLAHHALARDWCNFSLVTIPDPDWLVRFYHNPNEISFYKQQAKAGRVCLLGGVNQWRHQKFFCGGHRGGKMQF